MLCRYSVRAGIKYLLDLMHKSPICYSPFDSETGDRVKHLRSSILNRTKNTDIPKIGGVLIKLCFVRTVFSAWLANSRFFAPKTLAVCIHLFNHYPTAAAVYDE